MKDGIGVVGLLFILSGCESTEKIELEEETQPQVMDADGDGFTTEEDCDDNNSLINPVAIEDCDGFDNNCNGEVDEGVTSLFYADVDSDGFGDPEAVTEACVVPENHVLVGNDCDDSDPETYPAAAERCDGLDNDCDGEIDEDMQEIWFADVDGDGYGDPDSLEDSCDPPSGYVSIGLDCDDTDGDVNPESTEICDGIDNDCDQLIDDEDGSVDYSTASDYYADDDGDGHGGELMQTGACTPPAGMVSFGGDCDDSNPEINPDAIEDCDLIDNDCDGLIDTEDPDVQGTLTWYLDTDGDGYGIDTDTVESCEQPSGYELESGDCDDDNNQVNPSARETCNNVDENCNGISDDGALGSANVCPGTSCNEILLDGSDDGDGLYWLDPDGDGFSPFQGWCDMTTDGGGWTRLFSSLYPTFWDTLPWQSYGAADYDSFSMLDQRQYFQASTGEYTYRLQVGESGNWDTTPASHTTIWEQSHDPFLESTDGFDYVFLSGEESTTCGGFNGLHNQHFQDGGDDAKTTDQDLTDNSTCWWLQVVPLQQYGSVSLYPGYVDGYGGSGGVHIWQQLWVR